MLNAVGKVRKVFKREGKVIWAVEKVKEKSRFLCSIEASPRLLFLLVWKTFLTLPTTFNMSNGILLRKNEVRGSEKWYFVHPKCSR